MTILCPSLFSCVRISKTTVPTDEFKAPVGSSAKIILGLLIKALAIAVLCFCPPDTSDGYLPTSFSKPNFFNNESAFSLTDFLLFDGEYPLNATFSNKVISGNKLIP
ncbi:hypothetical protein SRABI134_05371 [Peribacillus sp. Bi134]|nr:hypothetical protein SRABI134_05371 [Peribacillus sp. Bi134]